MKGDIVFTHDDANDAYYEWGFNCGPASLCAVLGKNPNEIRPYLLDFEKKGYTNPRLMASILKNMNIPFRRKYECLGTKFADKPIYPDFGLVRIQWAGPWTNPGVPVRARYRHTHWVAMRKNEDHFEVFDINAMAWNWLSDDIWENELIPFILSNNEAKASGEWWPTHCWEILV